jgi:hypothetical protein
LLHYPFSGNSSNVTSSNNILSSAGTLSPSLTQDRFGNTDNAYHFNGTTGFINSSASVNNQSLAQTISLWFKTNKQTSTTYEQVLLGLIGAGQSRFILGINSGIVSVEYGDGTGADHVVGRTTSTYNDDAWHHVVVISNGDYSACQLYIDGSKVLEFTSGYNNSNQSVSIKIGGDKVQNYFTGDIDDVRLYYRALTETDINYLRYEYPCVNTITVYDHVTVTDELRIDVSIPLSLNNKTTNTIRITPNPTKDKIIINTGDYSTISTYRIIIYDANSRIVFESLANQQEFTIDLSTFGSKGIYIVNILNASNGIVDTRKIVLQ